MIEVKNLVKNYGAIQALQDVSFTVPDGKVTGLLGLNGAGKSTTMGIIAGSLAAGSGSVFIDGIDISIEPLEARRRVGCLPEIPPLYPEMKVGEYLDFVRRLKGAPNDDSVSAICEKTGVAAVTGRLIKNLSKGYRQRTGLAAALIGGSKNIILDEPAVGLDPEQIVEVRELVRELARTKAVLLSSHILGEVQAVCDRIVILDRGRVAACEELSKDFPLEEVFLNLVRGELR